ncbi:ABC transporter permease [Paenibacillus alvei]|uniref:ABC transporter permease n=2 Tax=Paenibacillus alvei TaxID=44250 RepID=UPI0018CCDB23|nr:ABC transporter permease [Paenibacillus alvei]MBG9735868.1 ABC transporter permease [Paenibacillus alvei]MBG9742463.1 ABC transporter permease [Paenibacillus alvei]MCY9586612.1 ABC transporter permease [Paenibacillus alvei]
MDNEERILPTRPLSTMKVTSPRTLAFRRFCANTVYQWRALRIALDWTVWLYIVVPVLLLGMKFYWGWWVEPLDAAWLKLSIVVWLLPLVLPILSGTLRTWVEGGDILFLRQRPHWWYPLVRFGLCQYLLRSAIITAAILLLLAPWLIRGYAFLPIDLIVIGFTVCCLSFLAGLIRNYSNAVYSGWKRLLIDLIIALVAIVLFGIILYSLEFNISVMFVYGMVLLFISVPLVRWRIRVQHTFEQDVEREGEAKIRLTALLLSRSVEKPQRRKRTRPLLFPKSGYIMSTNDSGRLIGAIAVKSLLRSGTKRKFYLQLLLVGITASFITSLHGLFILIGPVLCAILGYWLSLYWKEFIEGDVASMFRFRSESLQQASSHMARVLCAVPGALWGLAAGLAASPIMLPLYIAGGGLMAAYIGSVIVMMRGWKEKKKLAEEKETDGNVSSKG